MALLLGALGERARADDVTIGIVFVWTLGLGVFFLDLSTRAPAGANGTIAARTLFGSIFGLSSGEADAGGPDRGGDVAALLRSAGRCCSHRSTPSAAAARGCRCGALGFGFLVLLGVVAAEATQAVGALLLLGLLAAPAGAAHRLTASPYRGMALAVLIALVSTWIGLALSYWIAGAAAGQRGDRGRAVFYALTIAI